MHMNKESALYDPCVDMYTSNGRISIYRNKKICTFNHLCSHIFSFDWFNLMQTSLELGYFFLNIYRDEQIFCILLFSICMYHCTYL